MSFTELKLIRIFLHPCMQSEAFRPRLWSGQLLPGKQKLKEVENQKGPRNRPIVNRRYLSLMHLTYIFRGKTLMHAYSTCKKISKSRICAQNRGINSFLFSTIRRTAWAMRTPFPSSLETFYFLWLLRNYPKAYNTNTSPFLLILTVWVKHFRTYPLQGSWYGTIV